MSNDIKATALQGDVKIAIAVSEFNTPITSALLDGALEQLQKRGIPRAAISVVHVPGAVELALTAQRLAQSQRFEAVICLGAVIFGETKHFDYVCEHVTQGCLQASLATQVPVIFGVLTTETADQARDRIGGKKGHKGRDSANAALDMISVMRQIDALNVEPYELVGE